MSHSLADAKKAGVVLVLGAQAQQPTGYPGFAAAAGWQPTYELMGRIAAVAEHCPACKVSTTALRASGVGTQQAPAITSALQADPSIGYVRIDIGSASSGLSGALNRAGLRGIKIFADVPDDAAIASPRGNSASWWVDYPSPLFAYALIDAGLRAMQSRAAVPAPEPSRPRCSPGERAERDPAGCPGRLPAVVQATLARPLSSVSLS